MRTRLFCNVSSVRVDGCAEKARVRRMVSRKGTREGIR